MRILAAAALLLIAGGSASAGAQQLPPTGGPYPPPFTATLSNNTPLALNRKEFDMLTYLLLNKDRLVTRSSLAEHVWGDHADQGDDLDFVYAQIKNLRKKLKQGDAEVEIQAVYGIGYRLVE